MLKVKGMNLVRQMETRSRHLKGTLTARVITAAPKAAADVASFPCGSLNHFNAATRTRGRGVVAVGGEMQKFLLGDWRELADPREKFCSVDEIQILAPGPVFRLGREFTGREEGSTSHFVRGHDAKEFANRLNAHSIGVPRFALHDHER